MLMNRSGAATYFTSPACGGGRHAKRDGWGKFSPHEQYESRRHPHPSPPPQERERERSRVFYCASALFLVSSARSSFIAASGSPPFFLTLSPQVLTSGSEAFFQSAVCS